jgi:hypothetical protein
MGMGEHFGCQTKQVIFDRNTNFMFYENEGTEKSLTYFCPEQVSRRAKIRKSFSIVLYHFCFNDKLKKIFA